MTPKIKGKANHLQGMAAEDFVANHYLSNGSASLEKRWRGTSGEVDLVFQDRDTLVFVEVKSSRSLAQAAVALTQRQIQRLQNAAEEYLSVKGMNLNTNIRFDVALVAPFGAVQIIENALSA